MVTLSVNFAEYLGTGAPSSSSEGSMVGRGEQGGEGESGPGGRVEVRGEEGSELFTFSIRALVSLQVFTTPP